MRKKTKQQHRQHVDMGRITNRSDKNKMWFWLNKLFYKNIDEHNAVITIHSETYWCTWRYTDLRELLDSAHFLKLFVPTPERRVELEQLSLSRLFSSHSLFVAHPTISAQWRQVQPGPASVCPQNKMEPLPPSVSLHIVVSSHSSSTSPETKHRWVGRAQVLQQWLCECVVVAVHLPWCPGSPSSQAQSSWQTRWTGCCLCWSEVPAYFGAGTYTVPGIHTLFINWCAIKSCLGDRVTTTSLI